MHPLPPGETYTGIVLPTAAPGGPCATGLDYQLFLPAGKVAAARVYHEQMCAAFLLAAAGERD